LIQLGTSDRTIRGCSISRFYVLKRKPRRTESVRGVVLCTCGGFHFTFGPAETKTPEGSPRA
jgi:hypothetical protein